MHENVTHIEVLYFLLLVTDINVKFNEHVLMRARHLNLSQKRLQPQLRNALALFIRVSSRFEFLAAHTNQGTYRYSSYNVVLLYRGIVSKAEI